MPSEPPNLSGEKRLHGFVFGFVCFLLLYPEFIHRYYNIPNLLGTYVIGVPIEEPMFAASGGAVWTVAYEYVQGYRPTLVRPLRFSHV